MLKPRRIASLWVGLTVVGCAGLAGSAGAQALPFFPGAEGFGGNFSGTAPTGGWFANADVYHVTNLNDDGPGSLREGLEQYSSNRIIVFDVAGTIQLNDNLDVKNLSNYYIAGQTAPGPVTIYGDTTQITHSSGRENRNIALRYLTFRKGTGDGEDAITFAGGGLGTNMILDHVSSSWAEDEILSVANNNTNVTVQYSLINDALVNNHAYGTLIRPRISSEVTFHHNLYANNASRQARFGTYNSERLTTEFTNNVIYNWRDRASYAGGSSDDEQEYVDVDYIGNYLVAGPSTGGGNTLNLAFRVDRNVDVRAYQFGNYMDKDRALNPGGVPNGSLVGWEAWGFGSGDDQTLEQLNAPLPYAPAPGGTPAAATEAAPVTRQAAPDAYQQVIDHVGNFWWARDAIDSRVINNVLTNTGGPVGQSAPPSGELNPLLAAPMIAHAAGYDTDGDAMPDTWELLHGLNPNDPNDWNGDFDSDGYINLIESINDQGAFPAPTPIQYIGAGSGPNARYALIHNWRTVDFQTPGSYWQPSHFDTARIHNGQVTVDAVGQHAGHLEIAPDESDTATLRITDGWLRVENTLTLAGDPAASATLLMTGGQLHVATLTKGNGGFVNITGGELHADLVTFDLTLNGGTLAPGHSVGTTQINGDLTLNPAATVQLEIAAAATFDRLIVDDTLHADGTLQVLLTDGFAPVAGDTFDVFDFTAATGGFATLDLPTLAAGLSWNTSNLLTTGVLSVAAALVGDYNGSGQVEQGDLDLVLQNWGVNTDTQGIPPGWTNDPPEGIIDQAELDKVLVNWGSNAAPDFSNRPVPEPAAALLVLTGLALTTRRGADRRSRRCA